MDPLGLLENVQNDPLGLMGTNVGHEVDDPEGSSIGDYVKATPDAALSLASGAVSWIPAGLSMASFDTRSASERAKTAMEIQEALTYQPKTEEGKKIVKVASYPFEKISEGSQAAADYTFEKTGSPVLATAVRTAGESIPFVVPAAVAKGVKRVRADLRSMEGGLDILTPAETPPLGPGPLPAEPVVTRGRLVGESYGPEPATRPLPKADPLGLLETSPEKPGLPYPDYAGEGFTFQEGAEIKPIMAKSGKPFASEKSATAAGNRQGFDWNLYEVTPQGDGYAISRKTGKEFRTPDAPEVNQIDRIGVDVNAEAAVDPQGKSIEKITPDETPPVPEQPGMSSDANFPLLEGQPPRLPDVVDLLATVEKPPLEMERVVSPSEAIALGKKGSSPTPEGVVAGDLKSGDKVFMKDDTLQVTHDREGNVDGFVARQEQTPGKEFRPEDAAKPDEPLQPVGSAERSPLAAGDVPRQPEIVQPGANSKKGPEGTLEEMAPKDTGPKTEGFDFGSERGSIPLSPDSEIVRKLEPLKAAIEDLPESAFVKGVAGKLAETKQAISEGFNSPGVVLGRDPAGKKIYQTLDHADQQKNAFLVTEGEAFTKAMGKIKEGSESAARVGAVLDGKVDAASLTIPERKLYTFLKEKFDFLLHKYARAAAGSEEAYLKTVNRVNQKIPPQVAVEALETGPRRRYDGLREKLNEIREGKKLDDLAPEQKEAYWETRREMREILHGEFLKTLPEGEKAAYDVLTRQVKNYLPHIIDKSALLDDFKLEIKQITDKLRTAVTPSAVTQYKNRLREMETAVTKLQGGELASYEQLPRNVRFKFFETRKGAAGYSFDAVKAYQTYLSGIGRKIFDEPAVRASADFYKDLDLSLKGYAKWYLRHFMGWDRHKGDALAGALTSLQWMRTLGLNPRSAIVNITQRVNTIAEVGPIHSFKGAKMAFTPEGARLFEKTGIAKEVPTVLMEGPVPAGMEKLRAVTGYLFNKVEVGNRKHAFLSGYVKAKAKGLTDAEAVKYGVDVVHKTQFRYGRIGMPKALTHPVGRVGLQFWSYPVKQTELLVSWAKHEPMKLVKYLAMAEGGNLALQEFLGIDLSNALGIGLNYGEAIDAIKDLSNADIRGFWRHARLTFAGGGGLLPSGLGPTASGVKNVIEKAQEGKGFEQFKKELTPVVYNRIRQAYDAVKGKSDGRYPVKNDQGYVMYYLTGPQLATRTIGPRTKTETDASLAFSREQGLEQERQAVVLDITKALIDGDTKTANGLIQKYGVIPSEQAIVNEALKRSTTKEERRRSIGIKERYQIQREGRLVRP